MNCIINCAQNKHIDKRPQGLRIQIGDTGDLNKDSLLATNIEIVKSCGISDIYVILNCKFRAIYNNDAKPLFVNNYFGLCDALYKFKKYINDTIVIDGNYLTNQNIINELKSKDLNCDLIYPVSNNETDFLGIYRLNSGFNDCLDDFHNQYFNGVEYNYSVSDYDHEFKLQDLFYSVSINKQFYKSSFTQEKF